jgi:hypothetical protein
VLFAAAKLLASDKYKEVKKDYNDYSNGDGHLWELDHEGLDHMVMSRATNLTFPADIVRSKIHRFNHP